MMSINTSIITSLVPLEVIVQRLDGMISPQTYLKKNYCYIKAEKTPLFDAAILLPEVLDYKQLKIWQQKNQDIFYSDEHNSKDALNFFFVEDENASYNKPALHDTFAWQRNFENND